MSMRLCEKAGLYVAEHVIVSREEDLASDVMTLPYVIKPTNEGSSVGVHIVTKDNKKPLFEDGDWPYAKEVMAEAFI